MLLEVCKKGGVRKVLQARGIVGHDVRLSWDELPHMAVPVLPLVLTGEDALVSGGTFGRDSSFADSRDGRSVVA